MAGGTEPAEDELEESPTATATEDNANGTDRPNRATEEKTRTENPGTGTERSQPNDENQPDDRQWERAHDGGHNPSGKPNPTPTKTTPGPILEVDKTGWTLVEKKRNRPPTKTPPETEGNQTTRTRIQNRGSETYTRATEGSQTNNSDPDIQEAPTIRTPSGNGWESNREGATTPEAMSTGDLTDPDQSDDEIEIPEPVQRETYTVPIRVDLLPTE